MDTSDIERMKYPLDIGVSHPNKDTNQVELIENECLENRLDRLVTSARRFNFDPNQFVEDSLVNVVSNSRIIPIAGASRLDYINSDNKANTVLKGTNVAMFQVIGGLRLASVYVAPVTSELLQRTNSPVETGMAVAAMFGGWSYLIGRSLMAGIKEFPEASKVASDNYKTVLKHFANSLPGIDNSKENKNTERKSNLLKNLGEKAITHARRGLTGFVIGITPYIAVSGLQHRPKNETKKLNRVLSLDTSLVVGSIAGIVSEVIVSVGKHDPELANHIQGDLANKKIWYGVAASLMTYEWIKNRFFNKDEKLLESGSETNLLDKNAT